MMENAQVVQAEPTYSSLAIFSLVFAVLAWTVLPVMGMVTAGFSVFNMFGMPLSGSVIALACGWLAQRKIRHSGGALRGEGLTKSARIMAYTQFALTALLFLFILLPMTVFSSQHTVNIP